MGQHPRPVAQPLKVMLPRKPILLRVIALAIVILAITILSVIATARTRSARLILDLPARLLPGRILPVEAVPIEYGATQYFQIHQDGADIGLTYDDQRQIIVQTVSAMPGYTIGDLVVAWGLPAGYDQHGPAVDVYWGTRSAHLTVCSFQPDSPIAFIVYYLGERQASPWQGFSHGRVPGCV